VAASRSQHIAVIATEGTINGGAYKTAIHRLSPSARVTSRACSLFVSMAEEGWTEGPIVRGRSARRYPRSDFFRRATHPIPWCWGCTHFPALAAAIRAVAAAARGAIVDSAATTAAARAGAGSMAAPGHRADAAPSPWLATDGAAAFRAAWGVFFLDETLHARNGLKSSIYSARRFRLYKEAANPAAVIGASSARLYIECRLDIEYRQCFENRRRCELPRPGARHGRRSNEPVGRRAQSPLGNCSRYRRRLMRPRCWVRADDLLGRYSNPC